MVIYSVETQEFLEEFWRKDMLPIIRPNFSGLRLVQNSLSKWYSTFNGRSLHKFMGESGDCVHMKSCLPGYSTGAAKRPVLIPSANNSSMANQSVLVSSPLNCTSKYFPSIRNQSTFLSSFSPEQVKMANIIGGLRDCWVGNPQKGTPYSTVSYEAQSMDSVGKKVKDPGSKGVQVDPKISVSGCQLPKTMKTSDYSGLCTISLHHGSQTYPLVSFHIEPNVIKAMETSYSKPESKERAQSTRPRKESPSRIPVKTTADEVSDEMQCQCQKKRKSPQKHSSKIPVRKPSFKSEAQTCTCTCTCRNEGTDSDPKMVCSCTCVQCGPLSKRIQGRKAREDERGFDERGLDKQLDGVRTTKRQQKTQIVISCSPKTEKKDGSSRQYL